LKEYKHGCLVEVTDKVFSVMIQVDMMFRSHSTSLVNFKTTLANKAEELRKDTIFPMCCNVRQKLVLKYFNVRLQIFARRQLPLSRKQAPREVDPWH
jgi:hypothetical protein